jgi:glycerol-1-phosphate dehydrogenase [NAD(P)+]
VRPQRRIGIADFVRIKPGALDRLGIYMGRWRFAAVAVLHSDGLPTAIMDRTARALEGIAAQWLPVADNRIAEVERLARALRPGVPVLGLGGGKALDVAKAVAHRADAFHIAAPTSLSNDGFASPNASLADADGRRFTSPASAPNAVIIDTDVVRAAPRVLWCSGVGDLVAKVTAVADWKLAYHAAGTPVDDMAALVSDAAVYQFMGRPTGDTEGVRLLATALLLNGVAMEICGSSRPASGSEHLISHALDGFCAPARLHGLQVGVATYLCARLHAQRTDTFADGTARAEMPDRVRAVLDAACFREEVARDPFRREDWCRAFRSAPSMKKDFYTVLSQPGSAEALDAILAEDEWLAPCFGARS